MDGSVLQSAAPRSARPGAQIGADLVRVGVRMRDVHPAQCHFHPPMLVRSLATTVATDGWSRRRLAFDGAYRLGAGRALRSTDLAHIELDAPPKFACLCSVADWLPAHLSARRKRKGLECRGEDRHGPGPRHRTPGGLTSAAAGNAADIAVLRGIVLEVAQVVSRLTKDVLNQPRNLTADKGKKEVARRQPNS